MTTNRIREFTGAPAKTGDGDSEPTGQQLQEQASAWKRTIEKVISDYPLTSIGVGLSLGVFLGWLAKRR
jgi:ElaB/YqjD/DUF883 family membrane-anchored ribosome-binding protein